MKFQFDGETNSNMSNSFRTETILEFQNQFSHENSHKRKKLLIHKDLGGVRLPYPAPKKDTTHRVVFFFCEGDFVCDLSLKISWNHGTIKSIIPWEALGRMAGKIIWWIVCFGCAGLFVGIGAYAKKLKTPMWFWSGSEVDPSLITDVRQYNRENGIMWQLYSLWYFAAGLAEIWSTILALVILILGCLVGSGLLICHYNRICKKYRVR